MHRSQGLSGVQRSHQQLEGLAVGCQAGCRALKTEITQGSASHPCLYWCSLPRVDIDMAITSAAVPGFHCCGVCALIKTFVVGQLHMCALAHSLQSKSAECGKGDAESVTVLFVYLSALLRGVCLWRLPASVTF